MWVLRILETADIFWILETKSNFTLTNFVNSNKKKRKISKTLKTSNDIMPQISNTRKFSKDIHKKNRALRMFVCHAIE